MNTPTPRTDKHMEYREDFERCDPDFARTLETELTHANNRAHNWEQATIAHLKDKDQLHLDIAELNERLIDRQKTLMEQAVKLQAASRLLTRCRDSAGRVEMGRMEMGRMEMGLYEDIQNFLHS